jgi:hypothetical protein
MMRKFIFSLFFLFFMIILATCSMVKEQAPVAELGGQSTAPLSAEVSQIKFH